MREHANGSTIALAVTESNLMDFTRRIAQWTRLSGTGEERSAAAYAEEQLRTSGYRTRIEVHDAYISLPGPATLRVTHPAPQDVFCITHSMARSTGPSGVAGDLVDVGKGAPEDYARAGAAGKIALVDDLATPEQAVAGSSTS